MAKLILNETIRGPPPAECEIGDIDDGVTLVSFRTPLVARRHGRSFERPTAEELKDAVKAADRFVVFLVTRSNGNAAGKPCPVYAINLRKPLMRGDLGVAITKEGELLKDGAEILGVVKRRAAEDKSVHRDCMYFEGCLIVDIIDNNISGSDPHQGWEAYRALRAGSSVQLVIPADEEYREQLYHMTSSKDGSERAHAARGLKNYPGKKTVRILKTLLMDADRSRHSLRGKNGRVGKEIWYPVRCSAYESLLYLGVDAKMPNGVSEGCFWRSPNVK